MTQDTHPGTCRVGKHYKISRPGLTPVLMLAMSLVYSMGLSLADVGGNYELHYHGRASWIFSVRTASLGLLHNPAYPLLRVWIFAVKDVAAQSSLFQPQLETNLQSVNFQSQLFQNCYYTRRGKDTREGYPTAILSPHDGSRLLLEFD